MKLQGLVRLLFVNKLLFDKNSHGENSFAILRSRNVTYLFRYAAK